MNIVKKLSLVTSPRIIFIWLKQILFQSNIFYLWYTVEQMFVWLKYVYYLFVLIYLIWIYDLFKWNKFLVQINRSFCVDYIYLSIL